MSICDICGEPGNNTAAPLTLCDKHFILLAQSVARQAGAIDYDELDKK